MTSRVKQLKHLVILVLICFLEKPLNHLEKMTLRVKQLKHLVTTVQIGSLRKSFHFFGRDELSGETVFPLREYPVSWLIPGAHTESPFDNGKAKLTTPSRVDGGEDTYRQSGGTDP